MASYSIEKAKFEAKCRLCDQPIHIGEPVHSTDGHPLQHVECDRQKEVGSLIDEVLRESDDDLT